jgi:hypothetical protein
MTASTSKKLAEARHCAVRTCYAAASVRAHYGIAVTCVEDTRALLCSAGGFVHRSRSAPTGQRFRGGGPKSAEFAANANRWD